MKIKLTTKLEVRNMVKTKVWASIAVVVVAIVFFFVGFYTQPFIVGEVVPKTTWEKIVEKGYIEVASSPDWPPFEYLDPVTGEFTGFEVDILEEVMRRLSEEEGVTIDVRWKSTDFAAIKEGIVAKTYDLGVSGFSITSDRWEHVQYCTPHSVTEAQMIAVKGTAEAKGVPPEGLESVEDLTKYGLTCALQKATTQEDELIKAGIIPVSFDTYLDAMDDLVAGGVDCVYAETPITYWWIKEYGEKGYEIEIIFRKPYWPVAYIAHHDSDVFVAKISGQIAELISEGWIAELVEEYGMAY